MREGSAAPKAANKGVGLILGAGIGLLPAFAFLDAPPHTPVHAAALSDYAPPPAASDEQVFRIVAFGSSSTRGVGASARRNTYPARLERLLNARSGQAEKVEVVNRGIDGQDIRDMMRRLTSDIVARKPDLVIWQTGSNDSINQVPLSEFEHDLRAGIDTLRGAGVELMVMEPQWCPRIELVDATNRYMEVIHRVTADMKVPLIPRFQLMRDWLQSGLVTQQEIIGPDNLHMTDRGYELLAAAVEDEVVKQSIGLQQLASFRASFP